MKLKINAKIKLGILICCAAASLAACSSDYPPRDTSTLDNINKEMKQAASSGEKSANAQLPKAVNNLLLPPLKATTARLTSKHLSQRFDLAIRDTPVDQVLMGLVHDTPFSIILKPKNIGSDLPAGSAAPRSDERVTLHLRDVTLFKALDAIREVYGYEYTVDGNMIYVQPPELQIRLYQVNYIIGQRRGVSDIKVIGGTSAGGASAGGASTGSTSGTGFSSVQASALSTIAKSDVWGEIEDAVRTTLSCQIPKSTPNGTQTSGGGSRADVSFSGDSLLGERQRGVDGCANGRSLTVSQMSGTIVVRGMPNEHQMVGKILRSMQISIERQVIIEAKIIDVELNSGSQQGINWAGFNNNLHGFSVGASSLPIGATPPIGTIAAGTSLGGLLGVGATNAGGLGMSLTSGNFAAMISFLGTQGSVHVLSSPRIATLNGQKAVLKVGSEEPFVTSIAGGSTTPVTGGSPTIAQPSLNYQPFFSGISLDVTPQIDERDNITLHVHTIVNSVVEKLKISTPTIGAVLVPFAVNTINETDNVVRTKDGQVVVIGGLITESTRDTRTRVPGLSSLPLLGALFRSGTQSTVKRELVILLKPTIVKDDSAWKDDISSAQDRIENMGTTKNR